MKKLLSLLVVVTIILTGCSSKNKDEKKTTDNKTQVTKEKKEDKTEQKKEEEKKVEPISNQVSEQDRHELDEWVNFLCNPYHFPSVDQKLDFNDPTTIDYQFYYVIDYLEESKSIQYDNNFGYTIPEELIYNTGLKLFNKEYNKDSGGNFSKTYDESTQTYKYVYGGRGGANFPYFTASEVNYATDDQVNFTISAPYYSFNNDGLEYENLGTIVFHLRKTSEGNNNIYLVSSEIILF